MKLDKIIETRLTKERTAVIFFGVFGIVSAICLLIFVGTLNNSVVVQEIRQLVKNPGYKDPYGLDLDDILETMKILNAFGFIILLTSIFGILANYFLLKVLMIIYFLYLLMCFICFVLIMLAVAIFKSEWKLKFKQESRRFWMVLKTLTDGQATDDFERELSCCGFNNALDYCDLDHVSTIMDEVFKDLSILEVKGLRDIDYDSYDDDLFNGLGSSDSDLPELSNEDYDYFYGDYDDVSNYGDYSKRKRRADWEIHAEAPKEEDSKKKKRKRKNENHKKKSKTIDLPKANFKNVSPLNPDDPPMNFAGLFPTLGPSGIDDLHGNLIVNITWPFLQYERPNECSDRYYEFLYREGDERCVCDQILQYGITPAAENSVCITKSDKYGYNDITVDSVCGLDKFEDPICFLNGCGDIISERIQTHIVPWIVVSVLVYTIFYMGALISSFLVIWDRFKVDKEVIKSIRKNDTKKRKRKIQSVRRSVRSHGKSSNKSRNHTLPDEESDPLRVEVFDR